MFIELIFKLVLGLSVCHFLADFTWLSNSWMLAAKAKGTPTFPILVHAFAHSTLMTLFIALYLGDKVDIVLLTDVFIIQSISHFVIDIWKGKMNVWFPIVQNQSEKWYWILFGFDQFLHNVVILIITYFVYTQIKITY